MVTPIFKAGNKRLQSNFRPISLLPTIYKIIENAANNVILGKQQITVKQSIWILSTKV